MKSIEPIEPKTLMTIYKTDDQSWTEINYNSVEECFICAAAIVQELRRSSIFAACMAGLIERLENDEEYARRFEANSGTVEMPDFDKILKK